MSDAIAATYALERSVAELYAVFGTYQARDVAFCASCHTGVDALVVALRAADRRALDSTDVAEFFENVFESAFADEATFKALVPRILELTIPGSDEVAHLSVATLGCKLARAGWTSWPPRERAAIDAWARAWFAATLACGDAHGTALDDILGALGHLYGDIAPFLRELRAASSDRARQQSAHLVLTVCFALSHARTTLRSDWSCIGSSWQKGSPPERQMLAWLATHASFARLMSDATTGGCECTWVAMSTECDVAGALAAITKGLVAATIA